MKDKDIIEGNLWESDLIELGFSKNLMLGTGWLSTSSMRNAVYYYKNGRITINATKFWTWFLDDEQRNDIAVFTKSKLIELLNLYNTKNNQHGTE